MSDNFATEMAEMIAGVKTETDPYVPHPITVRDLPPNFKVAAPQREDEILFQQICGESLATLQKNCVPLVRDCEVDRSNRVAEAILTKTIFPEHILPKTTTVRARETLRK